jgi:succinate dehydrogenase / fumarate reductase cytochrome b subunit
MKKINRPLAPHLTVYSPQITSIVSIFHRISGSILALCFICLSFIMYLDYSFSEYYTFYNNSFFFQFYFYWSFIILNNFLFMLICFHFCNGLRHLVWDLAIGLDNKNVSITGLLVLGISLLCLVLILL